MINKLVVGVVSAPSHKEERMAIRETWKSVDVPGVDVFFIVGVDNTNGVIEYINDTVFVPMEESYQKLPIKTRAFCYWAMANLQFDYIFKCDDDTYVDLNKLKNFDPKYKEYVGSECADGVASGGAGYLLSRRATHIVTEHMVNSIGAEDVEVAKSLYRNSDIRLENSTLFDPAHFARDHQIPLPENDIITTHYVPPEMMRNIFDRNNPDDKI